VNNKKIRIIGIIVMAVAVVFLVRRFLSFDVDFAELFSVKTLPSLVLVTIIIMGTLFIASFGWNIWLSFFTNHKVSLSATYSVYTRSNLAKYLPGNVGHYAMRQLYGTSLGITQKELLFSSFLEVFCSALSAFVLSLVLAKGVFLSFMSDSLQRSWVAPVLAIVVAAIVILVVVLIKKKKALLLEALAYLKQKAFSISLLKVIGLLACNLAVFGLTLLLLIGPNAIGGTNALLIVSAGIVSWFIGYITPGVPGGIGVREAVLLLMLSPILPEELVLYIAVVQRLAFIFSDVFSWVIGKAVHLKQGSDRAVV